MRKIMLLCGLAMVLAYAKVAYLSCSLAEYKAEHDYFADIKNSMRKNPAKYYKRWTLMYCLGFTSDENKVLSTPKNCKHPDSIDNPVHIDNLVKMCGDEPLNEIKAYIDERRKVDYDKKE